MADRFQEYADFSKGTWLSVTERVNVEGPTTRDTTKLGYCVKRREGVERAALDHYWLGTHVPNVAAEIRRTPGARRYTVDLVDPACSACTTALHKSPLMVPIPVSPICKTLNRTDLAN
jgi:hypothetical protein